jgi:hypothetical protein
MLNALSLASKAQVKPDQAIVYHIEAVAAASTTSSGSGDFAYLWAPDCEDHTV